MWHKSIIELGTSLRDGDFSAVELTQSYLNRIESHNPELNVFVTLATDFALKSAAAADKRIRSGDATAMTGIPIVHKDIFCTNGIRTSCGSRMLDNFIAPYDATVVERLNKAGVVVLGKANMDEFAMGSSNETSWYGPARNPWDRNAVPGGIIRWHSRSCFRGSMCCRHGYRYRGIDSSTCSVLWRNRYETYLRQGITFWDDRFRIFTGPGWPHDPKCAGCRYHVATYGGI